MKVSVIMITYNHEKFIREAIEGVLMQKTNFDFELIIANDHSPDNTDIIVSEFINTHKQGCRIKYFSHKTNLGMMPNFIFALSQSKSEYIALCEGDDYWIDENKLQKQVDFLDANSEFNICFHNVHLKNGTEFLKNEISNTDISTRTDLVTQGNFIHTPSAIFINIIQKTPLWFENVMPGDYPLWLMVSGSKGKIKYIDEIMAVYRVHD